MLHPGPLTWNKMFSVWVKICDPWCPKQWLARWCWTCSMMLRSLWSGIQRTVLVSPKRKSLAEFVSSELLGPDALQMTGQWTGEVLFYNLLMFSFCYSAINGGMYTSTPAGNYLIIWPGRNVVFHQHFPANLSDTYGFVATSSQPLCVPKTCTWKP